MSDDDLRRAEADFLRDRLVALRHQLNRAAAELGEELGEPIDERSIGRVLGMVVEGLRRSGNEALATKYVTTFERFQKANETARRIHDTGDPGEAETDAVNDALEAFEHCEAEVSAWFDSLRDEGGAR